MLGKVYSVLPASIPAARREGEGPGRLSRGGAGRPSVTGVVTMRIVMVLSGLVFLAAADGLAAEAGAPADPAPGAASAAAPDSHPDYAKAAAHDPMFSNKALWPNLTGKEYFLRSTWPKARLYVWANPGKGGGQRAGRGALDVADPKNWLEDGKPAAQLILDENADLLFPASQTRYSVGFRDTDMREVCRHLTLSPGAEFVGGGDGRGRTLYGNVWIKKGGKMYAQGATNFVGDRHTFCRNDNAVANPAGERKMNLHMCSQYFTFNKGNGASVEFLGHVTVLDEFRIFGCTVIVGRDSTLQPGRAATPTIQKGGVLALLDGAYFGSWVNNFGGPDMTVIAGTIQGGLPDRPLARSATFGLAFKNHSAASYTGSGMREDKGRPEAYPRVPSLLVYAGGALRSYSRDPARARLVFTVMPGGVGDKEALYLRPMPGSEGETKELERNPQAAERYKWFDGLPRGADCYLAKDVTVEAVEFDYFRKGGIMYEDLATKAAWKNLFFGPNCKAAPSEMFSHVEKIGKGGQY